MTGPKAPKDPTRKRQGFYIMRNKEISGSVQPDGSGVQFIYLNDGRMISSAKIVRHVRLGHDASHGGCGGRHGVCIESVRLCMVGRR